jgi:hypothetical protein
LQQRSAGAAENGAEGVNVSYRALSSGDAQFLLALARRIVPESASFSAGRQDAMLRIIDDALLKRAAAIRGQFKLFLKLLRLAPVARYGRPLDKLPGDIQDRVLAGLQNSGVARLRAGAWGLKTLVFMGCYGIAERWPELHYSPALRGNELLHD